MRFFVGVASFVGAVPESELGSGVEEVGSEALGAGTELYAEKEAKEEDENAAPAGNESGADA